MTIDELRERLKAVMAANKLSQSDIGRLWGIPQCAISRFLGGKAISAEHALLLAEYVTLLPSGKKK